MHPFAIRHPSRDASESDRVLPTQPNDVDRLVGFAHPQNVDA